MNSCARDLDETLRFYHDRRAEACRSRTSGPADLSELTETHLPSVECSCKERAKKCITRRSITADVRLGLAIKLGELGFFGKLSDIESPTLEHEGFGHVICDKHAPLKTGLRRSLH